ncbi:MAG: NAD(P)/FAD-dependent oxidoreductase [Candidatus Omnitrophica bacterium]|nr:NAD(P)/FAD-dependent oxidoreductase [Candidatus Omnitrophota bacterium]
MKYDIIIIGAGVVGSAVARELSRYKFRVLVLEKENDVAYGSSGANSGVIHAGFNVPPGSLKAKFNVEGNRIFPRLARELSVPFKRIGKLVVARNKTERSRLEELKDIGVKNGVPGLRVIGKKELRRLEPRIEGEAALYVPSAGVTSPFLFTIALAECARENGIKFRFGEKVIGIKKTQCGFIVRTSAGLFRSQVVVNSAGICADEIARMAGINRYRLYPNRGEYLILDKRFGNLVGRMIYPVPLKGAPGLGIHITPTVDGNILLGPSDAFIKDRSDTRTTASVFSRLIKEAEEMLPSLPREAFIQGYAGIRPKRVSARMKGFRDYVIEEDPKVSGFFNLTGIESPGLTAAPAIAKYVTSLILKSLSAGKKAAFKAALKKETRFAELSLRDKKRRIRKLPRCGEIVCRCEQVTKEELRDAVKGAFGIPSLAAIKIRTRAMTGRCQGGFCSPKIIEMLDKEFGLNKENLILKTKESYLLACRTKDLRR